METLELKHIAPYLPYGLKAVYKSPNCEKIGEVRNVYFLPCNDDVKISIDYQDGEHIWMFKPILRPMSDLTKPCLEDGKIPIVELARIAFKKADYIAWIEDDNCLVGYKAKCPSYLFSYSRLHKSFSVMDLFYSNKKWRKNRDTFCSNQLELFQYLFECHFDVFGLIDKGLAIDINTIKS